MSSSVFLTFIRPVFPCLCFKIIGRRLVTLFSILRYICCTSWLILTLLMLLYPRINCSLLLVLLPSLFLSVANIKKHCLSISLIRFFLRWVASRIVEDFFSFVCSIVLFHPVHFLKMKIATLTQLYIQEAYHFVASNNC